MLFRCGPVSRSRRSAPSGRMRFPAHRWMESRSSFRRVEAGSSVDSVARMLVPSTNRSASLPSALLQAGLHLLVAVLLVMIVVRAVTDGRSTSAAVIGIVTLFTTFYLLGIAAAGRFRSPGRRFTWLVVLLALWVGLLTLTPDAVWLAFPLFILQMVLLDDRIAVPSVAVVTVVAIVGYAVHLGAFTAAALVGPVIGALVAVVGLIGHQAITRESEQRRLLIEQLHATQAELAEAGHAAGGAAERERLAREIHDTIAQGLSSIQLLLRAALRELEGGAVASPAVEHVERARRTAQENLEEARRFVRALGPPDLEGDSLASALEKLCASTAATGPVDVRFRSDGEPIEVDGPHEAALFRIAQSALANTVQHARASRATVTLSYMDDGLALDIVDDGIGFDPDRKDDAAPGEHFGLTTMRARADALGGQLSIESSPGGGTAVAVNFTDPAIVGGDGR